MEYDQQVWVCTDCNTMKLVLAEKPSEYVAGHMRKLPCPCKSLMGVFNSAYCQSGHIMVGLVSPTLVGA